jgi:glycine cleavage system regulatory protein
MANKIQLRRDTTANWTSSNPTLSQGEIGYELNTGKIKIGTGNTAWNSLDYLTIATNSVTGTLTFPDNTVQTTAWLGSLAYSSLTGVPTLATVATSGSYDDLINKPNIAGTYSFNVAADDSSLKTINSNETVKFIGAGGITTASDAEGNITITGSASASVNWGDILNKNGANGPYSIALGLNANAGTNSVSLGQGTGQTSQGENAVAIGHYSGNASQGLAAIAIGSNAGAVSQGSRAIAIGDQAGYVNQSANSIILNATGSIVNGDGPGFHVAPVRQSLGVAIPIAQYNTSTKELTYSDISINGNTITTTESNVDLVLDANSEGAVSFGSIKIKRNNILGVNSNEDIVIDPSGTGKTVLVNGATIPSGSLTFSDATVQTTAYPGLPSLGTLSGVTITTPSSGQVLKYNGSQWINDADATTGGAGAGTVTTVSVISANGFTGTVATASSTPAITITTSITGVLKGDGTAISAATAGTDYQAPIGTISGIVKGNGANALTAATSGTDYAPGTSALATGIIKSTTTTGALTIAVSGTDYQAPIGTITGLVKGNGANALTAAVAGTDYQTAQSVTGIVKSSGTTRSAATSGTDYAPGTSALATGIVKSTTATGALTIAVAGTDYQEPIGTITGLVKGNGANALIAAVAGTDYQTAQSVTGIVKSSGTTRSAAVAGTDYQVPITFTTSGSSGAATFNGTALNIPQYATGATAFTGLSDVSSASLTVDKFYLPAITKLTVTASGSSAYLFDQYTGNNPTIYAISGTTIAFDLGTGALSSHPFLIRFSGANYDTGLTHVTNAGVVTTGSSAQGKTSGTLYWKIPAGTFGTYGYLCQAHGSMIGTITIKDISAI